MKIIKKICPICVLVSMTWLTMLILKAFGYQVNEPILAMLMGGSAVGVSYTLSKKVTGLEMWWKLLSIPVGFALMFTLINFDWLKFTVFATAYLLLWVLFRRKGFTQSKDEEIAQQLNVKNQLKNCC